MNCPRCSTTLLMSDKHGVEIDYCPSCRVVWLDRGELEKIMEREFSKTSQNRRFNDDDDDDDFDDDHNRNKFQNNNFQTSHRRKKEGFWANLLDF